MPKPAQPTSRLKATTPTLQAAVRPTRGKIRLVDSVDGLLKAGLQKIRLGVGEASDLTSR